MDSQFENIKKEYVHNCTMCAMRNKDYETDCAQCGNRQFLKVIVENGWNTMKWADQKWFEEEMATC